MSLKRENATRWMNRKLRLWWSCKKNYYYLQSSFIMQRKEITIKKVATVKHRMQLYKVGLRTYYRLLLQSIQRHSFLLLQMPAAVFKCRLLIECWDKGNNERKTIYGCSCAKILVFKRDRINWSMQLMVVQLRLTFRACRCTGIRNSVCLVSYSKAQ